MIKTPNNVLIDVGAIRYNYRKIAQAVGPETGVMAVIKSDAYGHGMIPVAQALERENPPFFAVFELQEAVALREAGCTIPILVLLGIMPEEAATAIDYGLTIALFQMDVAQALSRAAVKKGKLSSVHVKVDTGMTRLGVPWEGISSFLEKIRALEGLKPDGIFSHLAVSEEKDHPFTGQQEQRFLQSVEKAKALKVCTDTIHLANSGAIIHKTGTQWDLVRPGIALYGSSPVPGIAGAMALKPAMRFSSRVVRVEQVGPHTPVSYGCTFRTHNKATIATLPVGYDDGFNRLLSNRGEVLIRGKRAPVVGRVCMNLTMVDVTDIEGVAVGDEGVIIGNQEDEQITADELASKTNTISYEVFCIIGKCNRRSYWDSERVTR